MEDKSVWFITDAAKGLGLILTTQLLNNGYKVAAATDGLHVFDPAVTGNKNFFPQVVNLASAISVEDAIDLAVMRFGRVDVVVNNAGYSLYGGLEELSDREARDYFDINVFGALNVIRSVMMHFRAQRSGHIFNFCAADTLAAQHAGRGIQQAASMAIQGLTQSLVAEAEEFDVKVTLITPVTTGNKNIHPQGLTRPKKTIADYTTICRAEVESCDDRHDLLRMVNAIILSAEEPGAPFNLFLGEAGNMDAVIKDIENRWEYFYQKN